MQRKTEQTSELCWHPGVPVSKQRFDIKSIKIFAHSQTS